MTSFRSSALIRSARPGIGPHVPSRPDPVGRRPGSRGRAGRIGRFHMTVPSPDSGSVVWSSVAGSLASGAVVKRPSSRDAPASSLAIRSLR